MRFLHFDFDFFKKNSKEFYFRFFSAKFAGYVNTLKNLYTKFYLFVCFMLVVSLVVLIRNKKRGSDHLTRLRRKKGKQKVKKNYYDNVQAD